MKNLVKQALIKEIISLIENIKRKETIISDINMIFNLTSVSHLQRSRYWFYFFNTRYQAYITNPVLQIKILSSKKEIRLKVETVRDSYKYIVPTCYVSYNGFFKILEELPLLDLQQLRLKLNKKVTLKVLTK